MPNFVVDNEKGKCYNIRVEKPKRDDLVIINTDVGKFKAGWRGKVVGFEQNIVKKLVPVVLAYNDGHTVRAAINPIYLERMGQCTHLCDTCIIKLGCWNCDMKCESCSHRFECYTSKDLPKGVEDGES